MTGDPHVFEPLVRVHFFTGQFLSVEDLTADQEYFRRRLRLHHRLFVGTGVVVGLDVAIVGDRVCVSPGYAIDATGEDIVLDTDHVVDLPERSGRTGPQYLVLRYSETLSGPVPAATDGRVEFTRIVSGGALAVEPPRPVPPDPGVPIARIRPTTSSWVLDRRYRAPRVPSVLTRSPTT
jgi:hypothetical protein